MIWVPKKELILPLHMTHRVAGWYKLEARGPDGRVRPLTGWFPNLITNKGLDMLGLASGGFAVGVCAVGTGNTTPAVTDTALVALVASTGNAISRTQANQGSSPYYGTLTTTWQFPTGAATGNLAEVGVGSSATSLFSRALILDGGGSPTTITVLSNEALNVTYQVQMYPPTTDVTGSVALGGSNYNYTLRAVNVTASQWWCLPTDLAGYNGVGTTLSGGAFSTQTLSTINGTGPSGTSYSIDSSSRGTYTTGTYTNTGTFGWSINAGNAPGGIGSVVINFGWGNDSGFMVAGAGSYQCSFAAAVGGGPIPKDNTKVLSLVFQVTWASGT